MKKYSNTELRKRLTLLLKNKVRKAGLFGSYARSEQNKNSDIDILVELNNKATLFDLVRLENNLSEKLGKKVDLVEYGALSYLIKNQVLKEEIRLI